MITKRLTLVLGAGASYPYGFPLGHELVALITTGGIGPHLERMEHAHYRIEGLRRDLALSQQPSIDIFLENRKEYLRIGKDAIALALMPREQPELLTGNWYQYLWSQIGASESDFRGSRLSIVTFNYDRSLEYYLWNAISSSFKYTDSQAAEALKHVPIEHVYGKLGTPYFWDPNGRKYEPSLDPDAATKAADGLYVIGEERNVAEAFARASARISGAEVVCFLGFGFHPENVNRLGISVKANETRVFLSCAYGMRDDEKARAALLFPPQIGQRITFGRRDQDALEFVGSYPVFR